MRRLVLVCLLMAAAPSAGCAAHSQSGRGQNVISLPPTLAIDQPATVTLTPKESRSKASATLVIEVSTPVGNPTSNDGSAAVHGTFVRVGTGFHLDSGAVVYDPRDFELQAPDGTIYRASDGHSKADAPAQFTKSALAPGPGISGNIVIDASEVAGEHGVLLYKPGSRVIAAWRY
jgi:hypothetical protein